MHSAKTTFDVRMGCDNCGNLGIYHLPIRARIYDHVDHAYSYYVLRRNDTEIMLFCDNCKLPTLSIMWWKDEQDLPIRTGGLSNEQ